MHNSANSRRFFFKKSTVRTAMLVATNPFKLNAKDVPIVDSFGRNLPWFERVTREMGKLLHGLMGWNKLAPESMAMYDHIKPLVQIWK